MDSWGWSPGDGGCGSCPEPFSSTKDGDDKVDKACQNRSEGFLWLKGKTKVKMPKSCKRKYSAMLNAAGYIYNGVRQKKKKKKLKYVSVMLFLFY